jgi:hypothetical protein
MTTATAEANAPTELEPDNATRLAIFDGMSDAAEDGRSGLTVDEIYERVIGRLRVLVPREQHIAAEHLTHLPRGEARRLAGERAYLVEKLRVCVAAGLLTSDDDARFALTADPQAWVQYPDGSIRRYTAGLFSARERLEAANARLRKFDIGKHVPHNDDPASAEFRALVRSMREHGFLKDHRILRFPDGTYVDGYARKAAASEAGIDEKSIWLDLEKLGDPDATRMMRRDTPLNRVLLALDANATRLTEEQRQTVLTTVAQEVGRSWEQIASDLDRTREWRQTRSRSYTPVFEAKKLPFEPNGAPQILVTPDHKIGVRTLLVASSLSPHDARVLEGYVASPERAKVDSSKPQIFARADDLITGIEDMLADPKRRKDPAAWQGALNWLRGYVRDRRLDANGSASA